MRATTNSGSGRTAIRVIRRRRRTGKASPTTFRRTRRSRPLPFVTQFQHGARLTLSRSTARSFRTSDWNNLSLQDVLPTFRWIVRSDGTPLDVAIDFDDAYWGGSSLLVSGTLDAVNDVLLYETNLADRRRHAASRSSYKPDQTGGADAYARSAFAFADAPSTSNSWTSATASPRTGRGAAGSLAGCGRTLGRDLAARRRPAHARALLDAHRPARAIRRQDAAGAADRRRGVSQNEMSADTATARIAWTASPSPVTSYNVLQRHADGNVSWLGGTPNTAYFVGNLVRDVGESTSTIEVEAGKSRVRALDQRRRLR